MPRWLHSRAEHILAKNPSMPKGEAFAIATQESHALGKSPKGYGTVEGRREAKSKFTTPKDDVKAANPGRLESPKMAGVVLPDGSGCFTGTVGKKKDKMDKKASGFTTEYDVDGNMMGRTNRDEELGQIFSRDQSFGFGATGDGSAKMASMRRELLTIMKTSMPAGMMARAFQARGVDPKNVGALKQISNETIPFARRHEIARNVLGKLKEMPVQKAVTA